MFILFFHCLKLLFSTNELRTAHLSSYPKISYSHVSKNLSPDTNLPTFSWNFVTYKALPHFTFAWCKSIKEVWYYHPYFALIKKK